MTRIAEKRDRDRLSRFTTSSKSNPSKEKPYYYTGSDEENTNSFYDNKVKGFTDLSMILVPLFLSKQGYELGGIFGTAAGLCGGLVYNMLYLAKLDKYLRKALSRFDPPY